MTYRLIIIVIPEYRILKEIKDILKGYDVLNYWDVESSNEQIVVNVIIRREKTESLINILQKRFYDLEGFRISLLPVEASLPVPEPIEKVVSKYNEPSEKEDAKNIFVFHLNFNTIHVNINTYAIT